jgi:hypothetical protein
VSISLDECKQKYEKLYDLVKQLEDELRLMCNSRTPPPKVKELQELTQAWRINLQLVSLRPYHSATDVAPLLLVAKSLDEQVCAKAAELLPPGEFKLSEKAAAYIRQILTLVMSEDFQRFHETVGKSNSYTSEAEDDINLKDRARGALIAAQDKMALVENPLSEEFLKGLTKEQVKMLWQHTADHPDNLVTTAKDLDKLTLRRGAVRDVRKAIDELKGFAAKGRLKQKPLSKLDPSLLEKLPDSFLSLPPITIDQTEVGQGAGTDSEMKLSVLDSLLLSLSGLVRLICASDAQVCDASGRPVADLRLDEIGVSYVPVVAPVGASSLLDFRASIIETLGKHCGDTSEKNVDACEANIRNVRTWRFGRRTGLKGLTWLDLTIGNIHCLNGHDFDALVKALATLI